MNTEESTKQLLQAAGLGTTPEELEAQWRQIAIEENVSFTNTCTYSPFWRLVTALVTKPILWLSQFLAIQIIPNMFLATATGKWLDMIAWGHDLARKDSTKATGALTLVRDQNGTALEIPIGTIFQSTPINGHVYRVVSTKLAAFKSADVQTTVVVEAEHTGKEYNIDGAFYNQLSTELAGKCRVHPDQDNWLLIAGRNGETDEELRQRTRNRFSSINRWHIDAAYRDIIANFANIPVNYVVFEHTAPRGPGSANALIIYDGEAPAPEFFNAINQYIREKGYHGFGDDLLVLPIYTYDIEITAAYRPIPNLTEQQQNELKKSIHDYIYVAFRGLTKHTDYNPTQTQPRQAFAWSKLITELHQQFSHLASIDFANDTDLPAKLALPRISRLELNQQ